MIVRYGLKCGTDFFVQASEVSVGEKRLEYTTYVGDERIYHEVPRSMIIGPISIRTDTGQQITEYR